LNRKENIAIHDKVMEKWVETGDVLHIWREYDSGYLTSYYVTMFRHEYILSHFNSVSFDFARIWGENPRTPSIDQRIDMNGKIEGFHHTHKRIEIGSE